MLDTACASSGLVLAAGTRQGNYVCGTLAASSLLSFLVGWVVSCLSTGTVVFSLTTSAQFHC
jgi:predicted RNA-binding Zn-ribbon protein involved in translation (DUF1610 family)